MISLAGRVPLLLKRKVSAFSLVEVVLALSIFAFCITGIIGLISVGLCMGKESEDEIRAANLTSSFLCRMRSAPKVDLTANGFPFGTLITSSSTGRLFSVTPAAPLYIKGDGTLVKTPAEAATSRGYAVVADGVYDPANRVACVTLTLWWPPMASFSASTGQYTVTTFIDTETP